MTALAALQRRARFLAVTYVSTRPGLYYGIRHLSGRFDRLCIRRDTDIVIEGFPRSANSSTVHGFLSRQNRSICVAHHKHHAAQILRAAEWGIPSVVLIRAPRAACLSLLALGAEAHLRAGRQSAGGLSFAEAFSAYIAFYEAVEPQLDYTVLGRFETLLDDLDGLIERVNARFGTDFWTKEIEGGNQPTLGWHALPNEIREKIKLELVSRFEAELRTSPTLQSLVSRAEAVHARYAKTNDRTG